MNEENETLNEEIPRQQRVRTLRSLVPFIAGLMALSAIISGIAMRWSLQGILQKSAPVPPPVEAAVPVPVAVVTNTEPDRYECLVRTADASMSLDKDGVAAIGWDMDRPGQDGWQIKAVVFNPTQGVRGQYVFIFERKSEKKDRDKLSEIYLARWKAWMDNNPMLKKEVLASVEREQAINNKSK